MDLPFDKWILENKLRIKNIIRVKSLKNKLSKTLKFKVAKISFVLSLWSNNGAIITEDPLKKNKISFKGKLFLSLKIVSSLPKWYEAIIKNISKTKLGNTNQENIINKEMII